MRTRLLCNVILSGNKNVQRMDVRMESVYNFLHKPTPAAAKVTSHVQFHAYLPRTDNNAAPRPNWFRTQAEGRIWALTVPLSLVRASHLRLLTLLTPFSPFGTVLSCFTTTWGRRHCSWLTLLQVGNSSTFSPGQFGGTPFLRRNSRIVFTLDDVFCIGQGLGHGFRSWLCRRGRWGVLSPFEWRLKLRLWLEYNHMEMLSGCRNLWKESWITITF